MATNSDTWSDVTEPAPASLDEKKLAMSSPNSVSPVPYGIEIEKEKDEFWRRNPKGIYLHALFGENRGQGEVGKRIRKLDTNGDGYIQRTYEHLPSSC